MRIFTALLSLVLLAGCVFDRGNMKFRFVSSGQNVNDALVITQTLLGNSLKPLAPTNLRMYRSMEPIGYTNNTGNIGFEWTRRSRLAPGLRPGADVPFGEEIIRYDVEIMNGANVVRTITVEPDDFAPILWYSAGVTLDIKVDIDEGLIADGIFVDVANSRQVFNVGSDDILISFTADTTTVNYVPYNVGLLPAGITSATAMLAEPIIGFHKDLGGTVARTAGLSTNVNLVSNATSRLVIKIDRQGRGSLYQDAGSELASPLGGAHITMIPGTYNLYAATGAGVTADPFHLYQPTQRRMDTPGCVYFLTDAEADFGGTLPSTLTIRVYQVSPIVGRGPYTQATFTL